MIRGRDEDGEGSRDPLLFQLINEVGILAQLAQNRAGRLLAPELNMSQFIVLNHFVRLGSEASLSRLARAIEVTKGAMTNTTARLAQKGFVAVRPDPDDGRGKLVRLTPAGRAARDRAVARLGQTLAPLATSLSEPELQAVLLTLRTARVWFDQNR